MSTSAFAVGSRWYVSTARHFGLEVEIVQVRRTRITVKPVSNGRKGRWSRQQRSDLWSVPVWDFIKTHRPVG